MTLSIPTGACASAGGRGFTLTQPTEPDPRAQTSETGAQPDRVPASASPAAPVVDPPVAAGEPAMGGRDTEATSTEPALPESLQRQIGLVLDTARASEQRDAALLELLRSNGPGVVSDPAADAMRSVLERVDCAYAPSVVRGFAAVSVVPERLWAPFEAMLVRCTIAEETVLRAVPVFRSKRAAAYLLERAGPGHPGSVRATAFAGLERLSGLRMGMDLEAWSAWHAGLMEADEVAWVRALMQGLAARVDGLRGEREESVARTVDLLRRLHLRTPAPERPALLVSMFGDPEVEVQRLGLRLARGDLASVQVDAVALGEAAAALLAAGDREVRLNAAVISLQTGVGVAPGVLAERLVAEDDPAVLAVLLGLYGAAPGPEGFASVVGMLESESTEVRAAARLALIAGLRAEVPAAAEMREILVNRATAELGPEGVLTPLSVATALRFDLGPVLDRVLEVMVVGEDVDDLVAVVASSPAGWPVVSRAAAAEVRWHPLLTEFVARHGVSVPEIGAALASPGYGDADQHAALSVGLAETLGDASRLELAGVLINGRPESARAVLELIERAGLDEASTARFVALSEALRAAEEARDNGSVGAADGAVDHGGGEASREPPEDTPADPPAGIPAEAADPSEDPAENPAGEPAGGTSDDPEVDRPETTATGGGGGGTQEPGTGSDPAPEPSGTGGGG